MVMLHIKLKGMKTSTTCKQYFSLGLGQKAKGQTIFFSESCHVAYQIEGKKTVFKQKVDLKY